MRVMIIGGTSGIGLALGAHYAARGAQLALCGRDPRRLDGHALDRHPHVSRYGFDIRDADDLRRAITDFGRDGLDLLIVVAGQYADAAGLAAQPELGPRLVQTNIAGLVDAFDIAAELMRRQGHGQLVAVASIAGLLKDYPGNSLYSASKRAAIAICDSYRKALAPFGIAVTTLVPGYVDTARLRELNGGDAGAKPWLQSEADAVKHMSAAIDRRAARCVFPWQLHLLVRLFNCLPNWLRGLRGK
ncbi:SDR family NAD(P)-dependent oxidoreductase [Massilia sp. YIM B02443]|uniref:SDR family NAD(P)-dependent oxidoreductase n=1 Tax=Massilia sp. YIM B02443 TaxID=3050127 RepID=UPI0025B69AAB|nr:SDR family NAD(P)-dependent oxidoreductase [Massilia sp. YIM B02443]MDN4040122.1 SDR family NAD(P)-dependent oxidoreductase [Massilia sp. YIM B02443]